MSSAAIGLHSSLHALTDHTPKNRILATIHTEGNAATYPCTDEEGETPDPGHSSGSTSGDASGLMLAAGTE